MLQLELEALSRAGFDVQLTGFDQKELDGLLTDLSRQALAEPEEVPATDVDVVSQFGDLWLLGDHRLLCGDGTRRGDLERVLDGSASDMVFTDRPYNCNYTGKTSSRLTIVNDDLGDRFGEFLLAA
jgi:hypothetical protein